MTEKTALEKIDEIETKKTISRLENLLSLVRSGAFILQQCGVSAQKTPSEKYSHYFTLRGLADCNLSDSIKSERRHMIDPEQRLREDFQTFMAEQDAAPLDRDERLLLEIFIGWLLSEKRSITAPSVTDDKEPECYVCPGCFKAIAKGQDCRHCHG